MYGEGRRVRKISSAETTIFVYNGGGQLVAEYSTQTAASPKVSYLTTDHLGSPRVITDESGEVTTRKDYTAFGEENISPERVTGLGYTGSSDETRKGYTGYEKDAESGLDFAQARYYKATHGRYTSIDPLTASASIRNPQTFNRYSYVLNNPMNLVDPTGLIWGKNSKNQVRWFDNDLAEGFTEFTPENWQYNGSNGRVVELDPNSSSFTYIDPVEVVAEDDSTQILVTSAGAGLQDAIDGITTGTGNFFKGVVNSVTNPLGPAGMLVGVPNPLELERTPYKKPKQAAYGIITEAFWTATSTTAGGALMGGGTSSTSSLSVVPEVTNARVIPSLSEQASALVPLNGGRNSVTLGTPTGQIRFDLAGRAHGGVPTPHMQFYQKNFVNGVQRNISRSSREAVPMTQQDIRIVRRFLERK